MNKLVKYLIFKDFIIPAILIIIFVVIPIIYIFIENIFNKLFRKNCFNCKYYKLYDVASCGDGCRYKCNKKEVINHHSMNDREYYKKCKHFKSE